jgi:Zn ribbon nucleic-acid-binding protein
MKKPKALNPILPCPKCGNSGYKTMYADSFLWFFECNTCGYQCRLSEYKGKFEIKK